MREFPIESPPPSQQQGHQGRLLGPRESVSLRRDAGDQASDATGLRCLVLAGADAPFVDFGLRKRNT
jgi:hypothetical protein